MLKPEIRLNKGIVGFMQKVRILLGPLLFWGVCSLFRLNKGIVADC